jgi:hypothetical protein
LVVLFARRFVIVVNTFEWVSLKIMFFSLCPAKLRAYVGERAEYKIRRADAFVILLVTIVTLFSDLAVAVITGCLFSAFMFAMETGNTLRCDTELVKDPKTGEVLRKIYTVRGPLFFGSVTQFLDLFNVMEDPVDNVLRFEDSPTAICDFSALEALNRLTHRYKRFDKSIQVEKLTCTMSTKLLEKGKNCVQFEYSPEAVEMLDSGLTNLTVVEAAKEDFQPDWQAPGAPSDEAEAEMVAGGGGTRSAASDLDAISSSRDLSEAPELGIGCCNAEA